MRNSIKLTALLLSSLLVASLNAVQKESLENSVVNKLIKIETILNKIKTIKIRTNFDNAIENTKTLVIELVSLQDLLTSREFNENEIKATIARLDKAPKNPIFQKIKSLLNNKQALNEFLYSDIFFSPDLRSLTVGMGGRYFSPESLTSTLAKIISDFGDNPSSFKQLNK